MHLDFKPSNVLVASGDRPQVADFGLAQLMARPQREPRDAEEIEATDPDGAAPAPLAAEGATPVPLTTVGGTPAYMPPEQFEGRASAASDQYAFGVSLLEALAGTHPFDRTNSFTLTEDEVDRRLASIDRSRLPAWLLPVLRRAVALDPDARWPDMSALADALEDDPADRRRRRVVLGIGASGVVIGAIGLMWRTPPPPPCQEVDTALEGTWDDARRRDLDAAMREASAQPRGAAYLRQAFDDYAQGWTAARREACEAARVERTQSMEALDLRYACLAKRRIGLAAAIDRAFAAPARAAQNPDAVAEVLARVDPCADVERLRRGAPPIPPEHVDAANELRRELAEAKLDVAEDELDAATARLDPLGPRVDAIAYPPLRAELDTLLGVVAARQLRYDDAIATLTDAFFLAQEHGDDAQAAATALHLLFTSAYEDPREEGALWMRQAEVSSRRAGVESTPAYLNTMAAVAMRRGELDRALALFEQASESPVVGRPLATIKVLNNRAIVLRQLGRSDEAIALLQRSRAEHAQLLGPEHPLTALADVKLANVLRVAGRLEEAEPLAARAAKAFDGVQSQAGLEACSAAGTIWLNLDQLDRACPQLEKCVAIADEVPGEEHRVAAAHRVNLAGCHKAQGDLTRAETELREAVAIFDHQHAHELSTARTGLADVLAARARDSSPTDAAPLRAEALRLLDEAVAGLEAQRGPKSVALSSPLLIRGTMLLDAGRAPEAIAPLERALALRVDAGQSGPTLEVPRLLLAIARHGEATDPARQAQQAHAAASALEGRGTLPAAAQAWLRDNPRSP